MVRFTCISALPAKLAAVASLAAASGAAAGLQPLTPLPQAQPPQRVTLESPPVSVPHAPAALADLVADLSSADFHTRELATVRIRDDKSIRLTEIESMLAKGDLPLEAHARLLTIARDRFAASPRAAMGVQFDQATLRDRIVIDDTFAPFDCHKRLEPGDILIEADGVPLNTAAGRTKIQGLIISRDPGDTMNLVVRRGAEKVTLDVKLGDFRGLPNNNVIDETRLFRAWRTRSRGYTRVDDPVTTPVHPDAWPDSVQASRMVQIQQMRVQSTNPTMVVHAGGRARTSNLLNDSAWYPSSVRGGNGFRMNPGGLNAQAMQQFLDFGEIGNQQPMSFADEVESLKRKRAQVLADLNRAQNSVDRAPEGSAEAMALRAGLARHEISLRAVDRMFEAIRTERQELGVDKEAPAKPDTPAASDDR